MGSIRVCLTTAMAALVAIVMAAGFVTSSATAGPASAGKAAKPGKKHKKPKFKTAPKATSKAPYTAGGSVGDAWVKGAAPGTRLLLVNTKRKIIRKGKADSFGSFIFYDVKPGATWTVRTPTGKKKVKVRRKGKKRMKTVRVGQSTPKFQTLRPGDNPPQSFYENKDLHTGLNYVTMRDGTELAMTVRRPYGKTMAQGPFPTCVEYSGYQTAAPHDLLTSVIAGLGGAAIPKDDLAPATSTAVGAVIGPAVGGSVAEAAGDSVPLLVSGGICAVALAFTVTTRRAEGTTQG